MDSIDSLPCGGTREINLKVVLEQRLVVLNISSYVDESNDRFFGRQRASHVVGDISASSGRSRLVVTCFHRG
jgi:hypothetical protein